MLFRSPKTPKPQNPVGIQRICLEMEYLLCGLAGVQYEVIRVGVGVLIFINKYSLTIKSNLLRWIKQSLTLALNSQLDLENPLRSVAKVGALSLLQLNCFLCPGTQRRTKKHVHQQAVGEDKKIKAAIKKFGKSLFSERDSSFPSMFV